MALAILVTMRPCCQKNWSTDLSSNASNGSDSAAESSLTAPVKDILVISPNPTSKQAIYVDV